jgi:hypothetical protein
VPLLNLRKSIAGFLKNRKARGDFPEEMEANFAVRAVRFFSTGFILFQARNNL